MKNKKNTRWSAGFTGFLVKNLRCWRQTPHDLCHVSWEVELVDTTNFDWKRILRSRHFSSKKCLVNNLCDDSRRILYVEAMLSSHDVLDLELGIINSFSLGPCFKEVCSFV